MASDRSENKVHEIRTVLKSSFDTQNMLVTQLQMLQICRISGNNNPTQILDAAREWKKGKPLRQKKKIRKISAFMYRGKIDFQKLPKTIFKGI